MRCSRRDMLRTLAGAAVASTAVGRSLAKEANTAMPIIDTHQHLWNLKNFSLPWQADAPDILKHSYGLPEYREATAGLDVRTVYMEVDVAPDEKIMEAQYVLGECAHPEESRMLGAVIGGDPSKPNFQGYIKALGTNPALKGVRQVIHNPDIPAGYCLRDEFVRNVQFLGERGLSFDLCMRPEELSDGRKLTEKCPGTKFIVDHCGNADPKAFMKSPPEKPTHRPNVWKQEMDELAKRDNVLCKISGIMARAPAGWTADDLAPIVNHCLDTFGPDRVVFGGDWPVCLLGGQLRQWVDALAAIISERPEAEQRKLWSQNAIREYKLA
jgi:L-fuconolactonase